MKQLPMTAATRARVALSVPERGMPGEVEDEGHRAGEVDLELHVDGGGDVLAAGADVYARAEGQVEGEAAGGVLPSLHRACAEECAEHRSGADVRVALRALFDPAGKREGETARRGEITNRGQSSAEPLLLMRADEIAPGPESPSAAVAHAREDHFGALADGEVRRGIESGVAVDAEKKRRADEHCRFVCVRGRGEEDRERQREREDSGRAECYRLPSVFASRRG